MPIPPLPLFKHRDTVVTLADQNQFVTQFENTMDTMSNDVIPALNLAITDINEKVITATTARDESEDARDISVAAKDEALTAVATLQEGAIDDTTIAPNKAFSNQYTNDNFVKIIVPTPITDSDAVNKIYVDEATNRIGLIDYGYVAKPYHIVAFGGEFNRADYPKLWAYLQANPSLVKTQAQWTTENTTNGMCGFFSDGNGTTTFRVPNLDKAFLRPDSRGVGSYQKGTIIGADNDLNPAAELVIHGVYNGNSESIGADSVILAQYPNLKEGVLNGAVVRSATNLYTYVTRPKNIAVLPLIVAK